MAVSLKKPKAPRQPPTHAWVGRCGTCNGWIALSVDEGRKADLAFCHGASRIEWVVVDIGMRMLTPRELFRAQGFGDDYKIDPPGPSGKPLTKTAQIRMCGNSVCPPLATAIVRAQFEAA